MSAKHTPGPWKAGRGDMATIVDGHEAKWIYSNDGDYVALASGLDIGEWNEVMANAHLIAAAPELLAACVEFVRKCECGEARSTRSYNEMKAAIAKAEGR